MYEGVKLTYEICNGAGGRREGLAIRGLTKKGEETVCVTTKEGNTARCDDRRREGLAIRGVTMEVVERVSRSEV